MYNLKTMFAKNWVSAILVAFGLAAIAARANYTFRQEVRVQELSDSDRVMGEYRTTTEISFDEKGRRTEKIVYAPPTTLKNIGITKEDLQDIESIQPFV